MQVHVCTTHGVHVCPAIEYKCRLLRCQCTHVGTLQFDAAADEWRTTDEMDTGTLQEARRRLQEPFTQAEYKDRLRHKKRHELEALREGMHMNRDVVGARFATSLNTVLQSHNVVERKD